MRLPENLDLDKVIQNNLMLNKEMKLNKYKLMFVCDALVKSRAVNWRKMEESGTTFAPLSSTLLELVVYNYYDYLKFLVAVGVMESDGSFIKGEKCKGYRFSQIYRGQKLVYRSVDDYKLQKSYKKLLTNLDKKRDKETRGYRYLTHWWDAGKLKIDEKGALEWIEDYKIRNIQMVKGNKKLNPKKMQEAVRTKIDKAEDMKTLVLHINHKGCYYSFSGEGHRFYNPISNLKSELRNFLTWDGQPLVNIDIKNSQPYLSLILHDLDFWEKKGKWEGERGLKDEMKEWKRYIDVNRIIMFLKTAETQAEQDFPAPNLQLLVSEGNFYSFIQSIWGLHFPERFADRRKTKKEVLRMFYCNPEKEDWLDMYATCDLFKDFFPRTYNLFRMIKTNRYQLLPILLQRLESYLVIDVICKRISKMDPTIPMFTIHDNIITTEQHADVVKKVMEEELERYVGYKSTLSVEKLVPEQPQPIHQMPTTAAQVQMAA